MSAALQQTSISGPRWLFWLWLLGLAATAWVSLLPGHRIGTMPGSDKFWHGLTYLLLALPVSILFPRKPAALLATAMLAGYGAAIEVGQQFVPQRSFEWADMLANSAGAFAGLLLSHWLAWVVQSHGAASAIQEARSVTKKPHP